MKHLINMKLIPTLVPAVVLFLAIPGIAFGQSIVGTAHDFKGETWNPSGEVCIVCHAPHADPGGEFLWNRESATGPYTLYSSSKLNAVLSQPDGGSKVCLSCHDGTIAVDNFGGTTGGTKFVTGDHKIGPDLSNDHPVSFVYDAALATLDGGLWDPTTTSSGVGGTITESMLDNGSKLQCGSCHDPHDDTVGAFLVKSNAASALCITCHDK